MPESPEMPELPKPKLPEPKLPEPEMPEPEMPEMEGGRPPKREFALGLLEFGDHALCAPKPGADRLVAWDVSSTPKTTS